MYFTYAQKSSTVSKEVICRRLSAQSLDLSFLKNQRHHRFCKGCFIKGSICNFSTSSAICFSFTFYKNNKKDKYRYLFLQPLLSVKTIHCRDLKENLITQAPIFRDFQSLKYKRLEFIHLIWNGLNNNLLWPTPINCLLSVSF